MKILMLNSEYPPLGGGQGNANKFILEKLSSDYAELKIDLITASDDKYREEKLFENNIFLLDIGKKGRNMLFQKSSELLTFVFKAFLKAKRLVKKEKYDLIIAWSGIPAGYLAYILNKLYNIPYCTLLRGADVPFYDNRWKMLDSCIFKYTTPIIWKKSRKVVANSIMLRELAYKTSKKKEIGIIHNGVDAELFKPDSSLKSNKNIIISVSRINKIKGFQYTIEALSRIEDTEYELWIVGEGPDKERLIRLAEHLGVPSKIKFLGLKTKQELVELYKRADVFCLSSLQEGMSNSLLEAMASGLPIVASKVGGVDELVSDNGKIYNVGDVDELTKYFNEILGNKELQKIMGANSREKALSLSWSNIAKHFYDEVIR